MSIVRNRPTLMENTWEFTDEAPLILGDEFAPVLDVVARVAIERWTALQRQRAGAQPVPEGGWTDADESLLALDPDRLSELAAYGARRAGRRTARHRDDEVPPEVPASPVGTDANVSSSAWNPSDWISIPDAARRLDCSEEYVRRHSGSGRRFGERRLLPHAEFDKNVIHIRRDQVERVAAER